MKFDRVVCINLARRADRWQEFQSRIPTDFPFGKIERYDAIDGKLTPPPKWWKGGSGAWGCYRSHMRILEECLHAGHDSYLVFEDDATFVDNFSQHATEYFAALPDDWGLAYLGGQHLRVGVHAPQKVNDLVYRPFNVNRTHAFAVRGTNTMRLLYKHLNAKSWHTSHHIDHRLGALHQRRQDPIYTPREWLCGQAEGRSNVCGRDVPFRKWAPAQLLAVDPERKFVAVMGLHSSGSSLLAMMLAALGVHMGNQLGGYHGGEAVGLADLCEKIVRFPSTELSMPMGKVRKKLAKWVNANRRQAAERNTIGGGKYPHLCVLGDHLRGICGDSLRVISIDRPLEESIESLKRRSHKATGWLGVSDDQAEAVQRWLWEGKQSFLQSQKHLAVSYAELLDNPVAQCDRIVDYLELEPTAEQYQAALALVDKSKRHVTLPPCATGSASTLPRCHDCGHQFTDRQIDRTSSGQLCPRCMSGNVDEPANRTTYPELPVRTGFSFVPANQLPPATPPPRVRKLAFVTSFFNPHGGQNRVKIFPQFAASLARCGVPLFCIEGLFPGSASQVDSDWEVEIDGDAVFWHKEPLLQMAIDWMSDEYDAVCWIDSDVILHADDIGDRILDSLSRHAVVQPWSEIQYLGPHGNPISQWQRSMALANRGEPLPNADPRHSFPGMAWACSRELLSRVGGMYTRCITGGGDVAWAAACWNDADIVRSHAWSAALQADVINWGTTLTTATRGRVGLVDSRASHLYHGRLAHRQYAERNAIFQEVNFDPQAHLERAPNGTLRWSRFAPVELREWIARYMHSRREDE